MRAVEHRETGEADVVECAIVDAADRIGAPISAQRRTESLTSDDKQSAHGAGRRGTDAFGKEKIIHG